ncbi:MAG: VWA domain-containing protein [Betaproteobacteria bacterium]|nr:VWA domain-containing protein [Betaproteobacteria bacterium]
MNRAWSIPWQSLQHAGASNLHWDRPLAFALLPVVALLGWLLVRRGGVPERAQPRIALLHPNLQGLLRAVSASAPRSAMRRVLPALALGCWVLALAEPQRLGAWVQPPRQGRDVVVLLDTSLTMSITDLRWNGKPAERLAVVKRVFERFVHAREGDRFGIIAFGSHAATLLPPTFDRQLAAAMLERARIGMLGDDTALGDAIGLALREVRAQGRLKPVLILYSDNGVSNTGQVSPAQAAALAHALGVRIFTVQVGDTPASGKPYTVPAYLGPQPDLRAIAQLTGGQYFYAADGGAQKAAIEAIGRLAPTLQPPAQHRRTQELYAWPLGLGIALWLLAQWQRSPRSPRCKTSAARAPRLGGGESSR